MRLVTLDIREHPRLRGGTRLRFAETKNVLLGKNGSGKTTLLELIASIAASSFASLKAETFDIGYEMRLGRGVVSVAITNRLATYSPARPRGETARDYAREDSSWRCSIELRLAHGTRGVFECGPRSATVQLGDGTSQACEPVNPFASGGSFLARAISEIGRRLTSTDATPKNMEDTQVEAWRFIDELAHVARNCFRFDEGLGAFGAITSNREPVSAGFTVARFSDMTLATVGASFVPQEVLSEAELQARGWAEADNDSPNLPRVSCENLGFLNEAVKAMGFASGRLVVRAIDRSEHGSGTVSWELRRFEFEFHAGVRRTFTHRSLSFGQKRLLALLYYVACNPHLVIADELVNGLHHCWIRLALDKLEGRQAFLSSQNPLLLDHLEFDDAEQVQQSSVVCDHGTDCTTMDVRNMTKVEAQIFSRHLDAGIQHVSEILEDMALW